MMDEVVSMCQHVSMVSILVPPKSIVALQGVIVIIQEILVIVFLLIVMLPIL
jgi:hypothetical protein